MLKSITNLLYSDLKTTVVNGKVEEDDKMPKTESNEYLMMNPL